MALLIFSSRVIVPGYCACATAYEETKAKSFILAGCWNQGEGRPFLILSTLIELQMVERQEKRRFYTRWNEEEQFHASLAPSWWWWWTETRNLLSLSLWPHRLRRKGDCQLHYTTLIDYRKVVALMFHGNSGKLVPVPSRKRLTQIVTLIFIMFH